MTIHKCNVGFGKNFQADVGQTRSNVVIPFTGMESKLAMVSMQKV